MKITAIFLCVFLMIPLLASCAQADSSAPVMTDKASGITVTERMFSYWVSFYKTNFLSTYGYNADQPQLWEIEVGENQTLSQSLKTQIQDIIKTIIAASVLYKGFDLKLSKAELDEIDAEINSMAGEDGFKSKAAMDTELSKYGIDSKVLKNILIFEKEYSALTDYLFNEDTGINKTSDEDIAKYFDEHGSEYVQVQHILIDTAVDETASTDEGAADDTTNSAQDAIDSLAGLDEDTATTEPATDESGTDADAAATSAEKQALVDDIVAKLKAGTAFEELSEYSEDPGTSTYPEGYIFTHNSGFIADFENKAFEMAVGDVDTVVSDYGTHILKKVSVSKDAFVKYCADEVTQLIQMDVMDALMKPVIEGLELDQEKMDSFDVALAPVMFGEAELEY